MVSLEIHKQKELQLCLRALLLRADSGALINLYLRVGVGGQMPQIDRNELVHLMREECRDDERFTIDQINGIAEMLETLWMKEDSASEDLEYAKAPSIYNGLLHFVDKGTLRVKDNLYVTCHWEDILRWHTLTSSIGEDLLVCAYLASYDLKNVQATSKRNDFAWPSYVRTDDPTLEAMLEMPLADIHAHLKGSSLNFDINWICLMNHIDGRIGQFEELAGFMQGTHHGGSTGKHLYRKAVEAAAIRLFLANATDYSIKDLNGLLKMSDDDAVLNKVGDLQQAIGTALMNSGKTYYNSNTGERAQFDYAIQEGVTVPRGKQENCAYSLLSGERHILYKTLGGIYNGTFKDGRIATLLQAYLLIKNEIRHEINQLNDSTGFANFGIYEERKLFFVKPEGYEAYKKAAIHLAVASFFGDTQMNSRYHETRITPEESDKGQDNVVEKNIAEIDFNDNAIEDPMFKTSGKNAPWAYRYIYHFIKERDNTKEEYLGVKPRHYEARDKVKEQAQGIHELRNSLETNSRGVFYADRVVGIDAANSEIACRPEVFAQAFRYLRRHHIKRKEEHCPVDLGITYHVGEDFMDVVDGLRAVDEAIQFLQLQKGDRIGHGLVLGVEVGDYYELRNHTVVLSLQMQIDNAAWLWDKLTRVGGYDKTKEELKRRYGECFRKVYTSYGGTPDIDLYFSSMLLRGDNPECYDNTGNVNNRFGNADEWWNKALVRSKTCDEARKQREARKLYYLYHYDNEGKQNGNIYDTWEVDSEMCEAIEAVQYKLLQEVEDIGIAIECNPTSNFKIGEIDRYDQHPITKFNTIRGYTKYPKHDISVSINTDDKGVFATSIEREYALVAHSLIRKFRHENDGLKNSDVYDWLDRIRLLSIGQRFDKSVQLDDPSEKNSLPELIKRLSKENEDEIKGRRFVERLKYCWDILFAKGNPR